MKKLVLVAMAFVAMTFGSCGNKTEQASCRDSDSVACDTIAADTVYADTVVADSVLAI